MTDLTELDELDYGDIDDKYDDTEVNLENPNGNKNKGIKNDSKESKEIHSDDGQIESDTEVQSDDGEIKSDPEDGEIDGSDTDGEIIEPDAPDLFPDIKPKKPAPFVPPKEEIMTPQQQARSTIPCRYHRQGYCQYGTKCHFMHDRPNMVNIVPDKEPEIEKGNYSLFPEKRNATKPPRRVQSTQDLRTSRPVHHQPVRDTAWEKGLTAVKENKRNRDLIKNGLDPIDARNKIIGNNGNPAKKAKLVIMRREDSESPPRKSRSRPSKKDDDRWDREMNPWKSENKSSRKRYKSSDSSSSSSSSSSESESSSESSGRATPKGYRNNRTKSESSDDESYKREKRLQDKAKRYSSKSSKSSRSSRSSSHRRGKRSRKSQSSSSSSSSSSESEDSTSGSSSTSGKRKLQMRLKEVERVLKAKKAKNEVESKSRKRSKK